MTLELKAELAADDRVFDDVVVVDDREHRRFGEGLVGEQQALGVVEPRGEIVPVVQALEVDLRDAVGLEPAVEVVEAPERLVGLGEDVPAPVPIRVEREIARGLDAAAEIAVDEVLRVRASSHTPASSTL